MSLSEAIVDIYDGASLQVGEPPAIGVVRLGDSYLYLAMHDDHDAPILGNRELCLIIVVLWLQFYDKPIDLIKTEISEVRDVLDEQFSKIHVLIIV